jgi:prophage tail gpP-like protein
MKRMILFFIMSFAFVCSYAQTKVKGVVKDATTNQAIPKATISAKNKVLAIANDNGEFEVTTTAANLTITAVGYTSVTLL